METDLGHIVLIRHAHSEKNAEDRHGGEGRNLTQRGKRELDMLIEYLQSELSVSPSVIYYTPLTQTQLTAQFLCRALHTKCLTDERLRALNLGVLAGLSKEEAARKYPMAAERLEKWRQGSLKIENLDIPEAENHFHFWDRGVSFLENILGRGKTKDDFVVVGTRSILILLLNILIRETDLAGKPYTMFKFDNSGVTLLRYLGQLKAKLIFQNKTTFLRRPSG